MKATIRLDGGVKIPVSDVDFEEALDRFAESLGDQKPLRITGSWGREIALNPNHILYIEAKPDET